jgi:hypothetical protein
MDLDTLIKAITDNPVASTLVVGALASVGAFIKPIARALQDALIRRIDQAWPDEGGDEERIRKTVSKVNSQTFLPRSMVETAVRKHASKQSIPPNGG